MIHPASVTTEGAEKMGVLLYNLLRYCAIDYHGIGSTKT